MFNTICHKVYKDLRQRSGLTQAELGDGIGGTRFSVAKFESGKTHPDAAQEERLMQITQCSKMEWVLIVCAYLSELIGKPVGILESHGGYEPTGALTKARELSDQHGGRIPGGLLRMLKSRVKEIRWLSLLLEHHTDELQALIREIVEALRKRKRKRITTMS